MPRYFTREEAEAVLPAITVVLLKMQACHKSMLQAQEELDTLHMQARGNGHHLRERILKAQASVAQQTHLMRQLLHELHEFGCELKDIDTGLIDFLGQRAGRDMYLCWRLGEERINYWHDLQTGFAGRQPL